MFFVRKVKDFYVYFVILRLFVFDFFFVVVCFWFFWEGGVFDS